MDIRTDRPQEFLEAAVDILQKQDQSLVQALDGLPAAICVDVTAKRRAAFLREQAARCRRLARTACDQHASDTLNIMAGEYEAQAISLDRLN